MAILSPKIIFALVAALSASAATVESGKFRLYKFEQAIGEENYQITSEGERLLLDSKFAFEDRGGKVALSASLRYRPDGAPLRYEVKGSTSRISKIDSLVEIAGAKAAVREGKVSRDVPAPDRFFTISGYAPISMQMMMVRYWLERGAKGSLPVLPGGTVTIEPRGQDAFNVDGKRVMLNRYRVSGLIWGRETLWMDDAGQLIAAITIDAEYDHFEAVREGYESGLVAFVSKAAADNVLASAAPPTKRPIAIIGATLVDGTGGAPVTDSAVLIDRGRITAAGPRSKVKIPRNAERIDARGKTVLPGLWDMHAHFEQGEWGPIYVAAGVTTVRDCGNEFEYITGVRDAIEQGRGVGPRLLLAGIVDGDSKSALGIDRVNTPEQVHSVVTRYHDAGFQQIKIYSSVTPEMVRAVSAEAHRLGMSVTGHVPRGMDIYQVVDAGMDGVEHFLPAVYQAMLPKGLKRAPGSAFPPIDLQSEEARKLIEFLKARGTVIDPTIALYELTWRPDNEPVAAFEPGIKRVAPELAQALSGSGLPALFASPFHKTLESAYAAVVALHKAGIPIVVGTDQTVPGFSVYREMELYVHGGMTPMEAIQAATIVPARAMKLDREVGTIEAGKRADLIILDSNPLDAIANIRTVKTVVAKGQVYDSAKLWRAAGFSAE
ncbi:MAG TPA: amidohydrolase family protein [Bryobacteraceae bacterium]|nr:amidohydrolase family protein [Bryobacteraceae bacterium]